MCRTYSHVRREEEGDGSVKQCCWASNHVIALRIITVAVTMVIAIALICGFSWLAITSANNGTNSAGGSNNNSNGLLKSFKHHDGQTNRVHLPNDENLKVSSRRRVISETVEQIINQIDKKADPCENFYNFACGKFLNETVVPDDHTFLESSYLIKNQIQEQMKWSLEEESPPEELHAFKVVKKFYRACMNEAAIEKKGLNPLRDMLKRLGSWPMLEGDDWIENDFSWTEAAYKISDAGFAETFLLPLNIVNKRINNTNKLRLMLSTPTFIQPSIFSHNATPTGTVVKAYQDFIIQIAMLLGAEESRARKELNDTVSFGQDLYIFDTSETLKDFMTVTELMKTFPSIPWKEYFQHMLPANITIDESEEIYIENFNYIVNFERLINRTSKRIQANYLMYRIVLYFTPFLNAAVRQMDLEVRNKILNTVPMKLTERWLQCLEILPRHMYASLAGLYVRKHFANEMKKKAIEITENVKQQFKYILQKTAWMDMESIKLAVDKLDAMESQIGYPEEILDDAKLEEFYAGLIIDENDFFQSFLNVTYNKRAFLLDSFRTDVNASFIFPDRIKNYFDTYNIRSENKIYIPFGAIQIALGTINDSPEYLNYGKLGFMIGNVIAYGFDDTGRYYDKNGYHLVKSWWTAETEALYEQRLESLKFESIEVRHVPTFGFCTTTKFFVPPEYRRYLQISKDMDEKRADYAGSEIAYMTYRESIERDGLNSGLPGLPYTPKQMFWISAANSLCVAEKKKMLDSETPAGVLTESRIFREFRRSQEFMNDFNCSSILPQQIIPYHRGNVIEPRYPFLSPSPPPFIEKKIAIQNLKHFAESPLLQ